MSGMSEFTSKQAKRRNNMPTSATNPMYDNEVFLVTARRTLVDAALSYSLRKC